MEAELFLRKFHRIELVADIETHIGTSVPRRLLYQSEDGSRGFGEWQECVEDDGRKCCGVGLFGLGFVAFGYLSGHTSGLVLGWFVCQVGTHRRICCYAALGSGGFSDLGVVSGSF